MANFFTSFDNGTFESYTGYLSGPPSPSPGSAFPSYGRVTGVAATGLASMGIFFGGAAQRNNPPTTSFSSIFEWRSSTKPIVLTPGVKYRMSYKVRTFVGANLLGSDNLKIMIRGTQIGGTPPGLGVKIADEIDGEVFEFDDGSKGKNTTVLHAKAGWVEIWHEWTEPATGVPGYRYTLSNLISMLSANPGGANFVPAPSQLNNDGYLYIDDITLEDVPTCQIAAGTPTHTKTAETALGADDGTVTLNGTHPSLTLKYTRKTGAGSPEVKYTPTFNNLEGGETYDFRVEVASDPTCFFDVNNVYIVPGPLAPPPPPPPPVPGPLEIEGKPINDNNFISWFPASGDINFTHWEDVECCWDIANPYRKSANYTNLKHTPIIVNSEDFSWFLNEPFTNPNFSQWKLALIHRGGVEIADYGVLKRVLLPDNSYYLYCEINKNGITVNELYRMAIYDETNGSILFVSNMLFCMTESDAKCETTLLRYRATMNIYGYRYEDLPEFLNSHRLRLYKVDEQVEGELDQYRAVSSGQLRNVCVELDRYIVLEAFFFDDFAHRAMQVLQIHDVILLNNVAYLSKALYKPERDVRRRLNKGQIELYEQNFSTENRYNRLGNITIVSDLLEGDFGSRVKL